jgi:hypothetical protein
MRWLRRNRHMFFYPGSSVQLLTFDTDAPSLGVILGDTQMHATHILRNVPLELGDGIYRVDFLVVPEASFEVTLGLELIDVYAVRVSTKGYGKPSTGAQLYIPTLRSFCTRSVQQSWEAGKPFHNNHVRGHFTVTPQRFQAVVVDPAVLSA